MKRNTTREIHVWDQKDGSKIINTKVGDKRSTIFVKPNGTSNSYLRTSEGQKKIGSGGSFLSKLLGR